MANEPVLVVDSTGISAPLYTDALAWLQDQYRSIYGADIYIEADSQDGQLIAVFARVLKALNDAGVDVFNAFSPATAQGAGLSSVVKINGLHRLIPSFSSAVVTIVGQAGISIIEGAAGDDLNLGTVWSLPPLVIIPVSGTIDVTVTSKTAGAVTAPAGSINNILTPTPGWQTVSNAAPAVPGDPAESDAALRRRQAKSTALPSQTPREGIYASIAQITNVNRLAVFENDRAGADSDGLPPHSIAVVVEGGDLQTVANTIALKKNPGTGTYGSSSFLVLDSKGVPNTINVSGLALVPIYYQISIQPLTGYVSTTGDLIIAAIAEYFNERGIHEEIYHNRLWGPANLTGTAAVISSGLAQTQLDKLSATYVVVGIVIGKSLTTLATSDLVIAFDEAAFGDIANGSIILIT